MANRKWMATMGAALLVTMGVVAKPAQAVPLPVGGAVVLPGTSVALRPELAGAVIADVIRPFSVVSGSTVIRGWLQDRVVRSNATGQLHFYFRIWIDPKSNGSIVQVEKSDFGVAGRPTDVDWRTDGLGVKSPNLAQRTTVGNLVVFSFYRDHPIMPGEDSRFTFVKTRATEFAVGTSVLRWTNMVVNGTVTVPSFQPVY